MPTSYTARSVPTMKNKPAPAPVKFVPVPFKRSHKSKFEQGRMFAKKFMK